MKHVYIAYAAAWAIHFGYLAYLAQRFAALKRRVSDNSDGSGR